MTEMTAMVLVFVMVIACLVVAGYAHYKKVEAFQEVLDLIKKQGSDIKPTDIIPSACMYYRHDFGLLEMAEREHTIFEAKEWIYAWAKALEDSGDIRLLQIFNELKARELI